MALKRTLLQVVQSTLGAMDSDAVDTIGETPESEQIVLVAQEVYHELATYQDIPQFQRIDQLLGSNDSALATVMRIPEECTDIGVVRYAHYHDNGRIKMERIEYVDKNRFLDDLLCLDVSDTDHIGENVFPDNIRIPYHKDRNPTCWTTFDDNTIVFDAVNQDYENTLHNDKSVVISYVVPKFELEDDFVIPLPEQMQSQYLAQVKEVAFNEQKQMANPVQTHNGQRQRRRNWHQVGINDGLNNGNNGEPFSGFGRPSSPGYGRQTARYRRGSR